MFIKEMKVQNFSVSMWFTALVQTVISFMISDEEDVLFWINRGVEAYNNGAQPPPLEVYVRLNTREKTPTVNFLLPMDKSELYSLKEKVGQKKKFVFIIHGFLGRSTDGWLRQLSAAYLKNKDAAVFTVDWGSGAILTSYPAAVENTKLVATQLRGFIEFMRLNSVANNSYIHIIGFSLGAHVAGFIGKGYPHINRITGLDPASLGFSGNQRLKIGDANLVDIIHTNNIAGLYDQLGDVDFYINDGKKQPQCKDGEIPSSWLLLIPNYIMEAFGWLIKNACSHKAAHQYFLESIKNTNCKFVASKTIERSQRVRSKNFDPKQDTILGLDTFKYQIRGKLYITTNDRPPYCRS